MGKKNHLYNARTGKNMFIKDANKLAGKQDK